MNNKIKFLKNAIIPIIVIIVMAFAIWAHRESIRKNIFIDYGIEPFNSMGCSEKSILGMPLNTYDQ